MSGRAVPDVDCSTSSEEAAPVPRAIIALALAAMLALPLSGALGLTSVGSFRMFAAPVRYEVRVAVVTPEGMRVLGRDDLAPHLSRDARRVLLSTGEASLGETHVELALGGLDDLARLACALRPSASRALVSLERRSALEPERAPVRVEHERRCR